MTYIICYDVAENKIRLRIAKYLESVGYRAQRSVFFFEGNETRAEEIRNRLVAITKKDESTRLLVAPLCAACAERIWQNGLPIEERQSCIVA